MQFIQKEIRQSAQKKKGVSDVSGAAQPIGFNPSQEMSQRSFELHYYLDTQTPHVDFHAHPFYEIYFFLEGPVECYVVGGKSYRLFPGDILMMPPGVPHHPIFQKSARPYRRYVLWLSTEQLEQMEALDAGLLDVLRICQQKEHYRIRSTSPAVMQTLEGYLGAMWQEEQNASTCKQAHLYGLCLNLLTLLNRTILQEQIIPLWQDASDGLLDKVLEYIHENYMSPISLNDVADVFYASPSGIEQLFRKKLNKPFYRYVTECRIIHAQALILSGMPLKEVGHVCGYNDYSNFYRAFTREVGISPSRFRLYQPPNHFQSVQLKEA